MPVKVTFYANKSGEPVGTPPFEVAVIYSMNVELAFQSARAIGIWVGARGGHSHKKDRFALITDVEVEEIEGNAVL